MQAVWPDLTPDAFNAADLDLNGSLTAEELAGLQPSTLPAPAPLDGAAPSAPASDQTSNSLLDTSGD